MEQKMLYSIITPVYNRADCIMRCMESVTKAAQSLCVCGGGGHQIEHIIVDDGSSDSTCSIVADYAQRHLHVVFVKFEHNKGTNAARNEAIRKARGKWCIILDSDDYFVEDALSTIALTMEASPQYKHYMFAPDDMQAYYKRNPIIRGAAQKVLLYPDFLNGYVGGDFIHVCNTEILRKHPFDERLRIHEGLFFLMFFKDAQQMLFTNKVVTVRERNRADSVSRDTIRTNISVIQRSAKCLEMTLEYFEDDMTKLGMNRRIHSVKIALYENYVLMEEYFKAKALNIDRFNDMKERILRLVCGSHTGWCYRLLLKSYLLMKYKLLKKRLKV